MMRLDFLTALFRNDGDAEEVKSSRATRLDDRGPVMLMGVITLVLAEYYVSNNRIFSNLVTLGSAAQCLGFLFLAFKVWQRRSVSGLSGKSLQLYAASLLCRLFSILQYNGYLPVDWTGDGLYQGIEICSFVTVYSLLACVRFALADTYDRAADTCQIRWFLIASVVMAVIVHPTLNRAEFADICWMCGLLLETCALIPQMCMLRNLRRNVCSDKMIGPFVGCVATARMLMASFWMRTCTELKPRGSDFNLPGFAVLGSQLIQGVLFADSMI